MESALKYIVAVLLIVGSFALQASEPDTVAVYGLFNEPTDDFIGSGKGSLGKSSWDSWRDTLEDPVDPIRVYDKEVMQRTRNGAMPLTVMPTPRVVEYDWMSIAEWQELHAEDVAIAAQGGIDLLFLGDSITQFWHEPTWESHFLTYKAANFGISTDKTQNLLWRLNNGATGILTPRVVVIMIGVNNFEHDNDSAEDVFLGVEAVVAKVKLSFSEAQIILLGVLPYGLEPNTPNRQRVSKANALIAELGKDPRVDFHDIGAAYLLADGSISLELMYDTVHPSEKGYEVYAKALDPVLQNLLK